MRLGAALLFLMLIAAGCSSGGEKRPSPSALRQACVERWNWMHYDHDFTDSTAPVKVRTEPCRIEVGYRFGRVEESLSFYFPCSLNRFGAYVCPEHAVGLPGGSPRKGHNGRYFAKDGKIRLNRPPAHPISVPKPAWVRRYPVTQGFIDPFDHNGELRPGLRLGRPARPLSCSTYRDINQSTLIGCGAGLYCFVPRLPVRNRELIACPTDRGSGVFDRGRLVVYRNQ